MKQRLVIYDFDGTFFKSPDRQSGCQSYHDHHGTHFPYQGWWGRIETLLPPIVPVKPDASWFLHGTINQYRQDLRCPDSRIVLMTGRPKKFRNRVLELLSYQGVKFEENFFCDDHGSEGTGTWNIKANRLRGMLHNDLKVIEIWDDDPDKLEQWHKFVPELQDKLPHLVKIQIHDAKVEGNQPS